MSSSMSFREQMEGFPWTQILVISLVRLAEPIAFSSLFTYVYYMVEDLGVAETKADVSKYAGFLASSFALCQVVTAVFWGSFADKHGRKPTILIGLTGSVVSVLMFGFAESYTMALLARCLMGLVNGNVTVIRTMLGEVTHEKKHQALAFAVMPLIWNLGCVVGPLIGGFLSGKETSLGFLKEFVAMFPYARPNIVIAFILLTSGLIALFFMEETHYRYKSRRDPFLELGDKFLMSKFSIPPKLRPWQNGYDEESQYSVPLRDMSSAGSVTDSEPSTPMKAKSDNTRVQTKSVLHQDEADEQPTSFRDIMTVHIFAAVFSIFLISAHSVVVDEFFPVFLSSPTARYEDGTLKSYAPFKIAGGLGFTSQDTGTLLSSTGMVTVFFIILVLPHIQRKMDTLTIYKTFSFPIPFLYLAIPYVVLLADTPGWANFSVYLICALRSMCVNLLFPQVNLIVHTCAPPKQRGYVNGIAIAFGSAARATAPFLWGFIMSFGQAHDVAWLGWWFLAALAGVALYYSKNLTDEDLDDTVRLEH